MTVAAYPLLLSILAVACWAQALSARRDLSTRVVEDARFHAPPAPTSDDPLELLNVVLLASVDGRLHAVDRKRGKLLWSMDLPEAGASVPSYLRPLVTTEHIASSSETYMIEPQSGDIYVAADADDSLTRLPFSMPQLVDMSPFSFGETDARVFVGRKKTSLLLIELSTGRVKAALDSECPWESEGEDGPVDLDELERDDYPVDIYIGRADYQVSILHQKKATRGPVQKLSFSAYGPNNQDQDRQLRYRHSQDNLYVEPLPNGDVLALHVDSDDTQRTAPLWYLHFDSPIVAVFDVVRTPNRSPFALLQPRPRVESMFSLEDLSVHARRADTERAYIGLTHDSLYALSPDRYPLVLFTHDYRPAARALPPAACIDDPRDPRCATGIRPLRQDSRSRLARLLDGAPAATLLPSPPINDSNDMPPHEALPNLPMNPAANGSRTIFGWPIPIPIPTPTLDAPGWTGSGVLALLACAMFGLGTLWASRRRPLAPVPPFVTPQAPVAVPSAITQAPATEMHEDSSPASSSPATPENMPLALVTDKRPSTPAPATPSASSATLVPPTPATPSTPSAAEGEDDEDDEPAPGKRKGTRRKRGKRKRGGAKDAFAALEQEEGTGTEQEGENEPTPLAVTPMGTLSLPTPVPAAAPSLTVSDTVLGFGSHGTVVYQGSLQGRAVAVKRLLNDFTTLALREVSLLQDADDHPNVIRYYYQEAHTSFLYIALELCPASLADVIERPHVHPDLSNAFRPKRALSEIASGLRHLHALKIVHRDIKPQNILISSERKGHRMLISDFGLCRKLEFDQTSFLPTAGGAMGVGTFGWRAPEILRGEVVLDGVPADDGSTSSSSRGSTSTATSVNAHTGANTTLRRLTKSVDIFALGCLFYYCLTSGDHPFGDRFEREVNILKNAFELKGLDVFGEEGVEAQDLIAGMLAPEAGDRPDTTAILMHPYFWDAGKRLNFLQDASDRFEIMPRDPRDPMLTTLETNAHSVIGPDWIGRLDRVFADNLGKFRKYDCRSVQDLLRALRNKKHHYQDLPDGVRRAVGAMPAGYLAYFTRRWPRLFLHVYGVIEGSGLRGESMFRAYFSLPDAP
ncbi:kinase-like protein [Peniophora sp. CONT]|nr:kinase-like protein [Peniophora sp. CONT]